MEMDDGQVAGCICRFPFHIFHFFWRAVTVLIGYNSPALHYIPVVVQCKPIVSDTGMPFQSGLGGSGCVLWIMLDVKWMMGKLQIPHSSYIFR
ncbi:hypothetical protein, partial [Pedobacter miscanthi]